MTQSTQPALALDGEMSITYQERSALVKLLTAPNVSITELNGVGAAMIANLARRELITATEGDDGITRYSISKAGCAAIGQPEPLAETDDTDETITAADDEIAKPHESIDIEALVLNEFYIRWAEHGSEWSLPGALAGRDQCAALANRNLLSSKREGRIVRYRITPGGAKVLGLPYPPNATAPAAAPAIAPADEADHQEAALESLTDEAQPEAAQAPDNAAVLQNLQVATDELKSVGEPATDYEAEVIALRASIGTLQKVITQQASMLIQQVTAVHPVEIKTLVQSLGKVTSNEADAELAQSLNERWEIVNITVTTSMIDGALNYRRIVTLRRPLTSMPQPQPEQTAAADVVFNPTVAAKQPDKPLTIRLPRKKNEGAYRVPNFQLDPTQYPIGAKIAREGVDAHLDDVRTTALRAGQAAFNTAITSRQPVTPFPRALTANVQ